MQRIFLLTITYCMTIVLLNLNTAYSAENNSNDKLPLMVLDYENVKPTQMASEAYQAFFPLPRLKEVDVDYNKISSFVTNIKNNLCDNDRNVNYEVWISANVNGELMVVSGGVETGIKAIIDCKDNTNNR